MRVVVLAKAPVAGRSKTRLLTRWSPAETAALAEASLADTLETVARVDAEHHLALDGEPGAWLPEGYVVSPQVTGDLGTRICAALQGSPVPTLLIGMDTPQVTVADLRLGLELLTTHDASFGLATDGGWWALGLALPATHAGVVRGVPTSRDDTGSLQLQAIRAAGLSVAVLPTLRDVDLPEDADAVADAIPASRFGRLVAAL